MLEQNDQRVTFEVFNNHVTKSNAFLQTQNIKLMTAKYKDFSESIGVTDKYINMNERSAMKQEHVLASIFYTSFDKLSSKFSDTYKKLNDSETEYELKKRYKKHHHFGKHSFEVVNFYGFDIQHQVLSDEKGFVYHGIDKRMLFNSMIATINGPIRGLQLVQSVPTTVKHSSTVLFNYHVIC